MDDLEPFFPDRMASRILGLGDIKTLIEKAQSAMDFGKDSFDKQHGLHLMLVCS